jgi:hypothetical protein
MRKWIGKADYNWQLLPIEEESPNESLLGGVWGVASG